MKRAWGRGPPCSARSAWWPGGCLFKRSGGVGARGRQARCHGTRTAGAAGPLGSLVSSCLRQCRGCAALGLQLLGLAWPATTSTRSLVACVACWGRTAAAPSAARRTSRSSRASPVLATSAWRAQLLRGIRTCSSRAAHRAQLGRCPYRLSLNEMTSPLWFWCFCVWAADHWPPGSALQLQPGM